MTIIGQLSIKSYLIHSPSTHYKYMFLFPLIGYMPLHTYAVLEIRIRNWSAILLKIGYLLGY